MHYFAYCTWLNDPELRRYFPEAKLVTKGYAANHRLQFHAAGERTDRGWCHFNSAADAWGNKCLGVVFEHPEKHFDEDYDDFERCAVTVHGDDGKVYDCWTYRMTRPGVPMRPPNFYWQHIPDGMKAHGFPQPYVDSVLATYEAPRPARAPTGRTRRPFPGKSADSR